MGLGLWWQRWVLHSEDIDRPPKGPKSVNIFLGFFFIVNFCLGTGFLGIPYAFFHTGLPVAITTLLIIAFVSWNNATWEVEVMARAQVGWSGVGGVMVRGWSGVGWVMARAQVGWSGVMTRAQVGWSGVGGVMVRAWSGVGGSWQGLR